MHEKDRRGPSHINSIASMSRFPIPRPPQLVASSAKSSGSHLRCDGEQCRAILFENIVSSSVYFDRLALFALVLVGLHLKR